MLQTPQGVKVTEHEFQATYDHVLQELDDAAHRLLGSIDSAVKTLKPESASGLKRFAVFDLMRSIALHDQTDPLNPLHDMAERNLGTHDIGRCEAFVEHHFGVLVWSYLLESDEAWAFVNNFNPETDCNYEQFDKTYTESAV